MPEGLGFRVWGGVPLAFTQPVEKLAPGGTEGGMSQALTAWLVLSHFSTSDAEGSVIHRRILLCSFSNWLSTPASAASAAVICQTEAIESYLYDRASRVTSMSHQSGYLGSQQNDKEANDHMPQPRKELEFGIVDDRRHRWQGHSWSFRRSDRTNARRRRRFVRALQTNS